MMFSLFGAKVSNLMLYYYIVTAMDFGGEYRVLVARRTQITICRNEGWKTYRYRNL